MEARYLHGKGVSALVIGPQGTPPSPTGGNTVHSDTFQEKKPRGQTESTQCAWPRLILLTSRSALRGHQNNSATATSLLAPNAILWNPWLDQYFTHEFLL